MNGHRTRFTSSAARDAAMRAYQTPITVPAGDHDGLRLSAVPLARVLSVPFCQGTS